MLALSMVMYVVSAIHWAIDIARVNVLWFGLTGEARMIQFFVMYLPTINVHPCLKTYLANMVANHGQVRSKRCDRPVASLGAVESQSLVVHPPDDLSYLYHWWASSDCLRLSPE
jgi:hypothetical protein